MPTISIHEFKKIRTWTYEVYTMLASQASGASVIPVVAKTYEKIMLSMESLFLEEDSKGVKSVERIINKLKDL